MVIFTAEAFSSLFCLPAGDAVNAVFGPFLDHSDHQLSN